MGSVRLCQGHARVRDGPWFDARRLPSPFYTYMSRLHTRLRCGMRRTCPDFTSRLLQALQPFKSRPELYDDLSVYRLSYRVASTTNSLQSPIRGS